jgi:hypothetical protein
MKTAKREFLMDVKRMPSVPRLSLNLESDGIDERSFPIIVCQRNQRS